MTSNFSMCLIMNSRLVKALDGSISDFSRHVEKRAARPNPPAPFPTREGGEIKASLLVG